jgi:hypothetical protein
MARCAIYGMVRLFEKINDERSPQARASRMIVRNRAAPSVALITARINPEPRLMPSRGKSQLAMNAPTTPHATTARRRKIRRLRRKSSIIPLLNPQRRSLRKSSQVLSSGRQRRRFRLGKPLRRQLDAWRLSPSGIRCECKSPRLAGITISAERVRKNRRVRACVWLAINSR